MRKTPAFALTLLLGLSTAVPLASADPPPSHAAQEADRAVHRASRTGRQLLGLLDDSRRAGRVREAQCLDSTLTQINSFTRTLTHRRARLLAAERDEDPRASARERRVIRVLNGQLRALARQGRSCVMEVSEADGMTVVVVEIHPNTPQLDLSRVDGDQRRWR